MRAVIPSVLALLALAPAVHADMTVPPFTSIGREVVLEFVEPHPGWTFFAVAGFDRRVERVTTTAPVALSQLLGDDYTTRRMGVQLYAIPNEVLAEIGSPATDRTWFDKNAKNPRVQRLGVGVLSESTTYFDPRARVVERYRVIATDNGFELESIQEQAEWSWPTVVVMGFLSLALALGGIWLVRWLRRKSLTRTAPPPGN